MAKAEHFKRLSSGLLRISLLYTLLDVLRVGRTGLRGLDVSAVRALAFHIYNAWFRRGQGDVSLQHCVLAQLAWRTVSASR